jgi:hypothetical protein
MATKREAGRVVVGAAVSFLTSLGIAFSQDQARTIAWLNRCRRLAKDWENLNRKALAFLRLASIRLMLRKLCNPT